MSVARVAEWVVVVAVAVAVHVAVFVRLPEAAVGDAGAEGRSSVSLEAMTPQLAAMIARVDLAEAVETPDAVAAPPAAPVAETAPSIAARPETAVLSPPSPVPPAPVRPPVSPALPLAAVPEVAAQVALPVAPVPSEWTTGVASSVVPGQPERSRDQVEPMPPVASAAATVAPRDTSSERTPPVETPASTAAVSPPLMAPQVASASEPVSPAKAEAPKVAASRTPTAPQPVARTEDPAVGPTSPTLSAVPPEAAGESVSLAALPVDPAASAQAPEVSPKPPRRPERTARAAPPAEPASPVAPTAQPATPAGQRAQRDQPAPREQAALRAQGSGGGAQAGTARAGTPSLSEAQRSSLMARWGGQIRSRIERRKPRGAVGRGAVTLRIAVASDGRLVGLTVARSSGIAEIDTAALQAVRRAGRFPKAPRGLPSGPHSFSLPVQFTR